MGNFEKEYFHKAAFMLHQATEHFYTTILLVFTDYRPKDHNLETLGLKVEMCDKRFAVFPQTTDTIGSAPALQAGSTPHAS